MTDMRKDGYTPGPHAFNLGRDHWGEYVQWAPDRDLNPHVAMWPDVERWGMLIFHRNPAGERCAGMVTFAGDVQRQVAPDATTWDVDAWEPLTIRPSVLCSCGDHGFVSQGVWVPA
jgi:hypothetical protein